MPTNLYGPGDNFSPTGSHVLPALIRRFDEARAAASAERHALGHRVTRGASSCTSTTSPRRASTCSSTTTDRARSTSAPAATSRSARSPSWSPTSSATTGQTVWDTSKPDGTPRKLLDVSRLRDLGWSAHIPLRDGIAATVDWYRAHADHLREVG